MLCFGDSPDPDPDPDPTGDGLIGSACGGDEDCSGADCYENNASGWIDGYCLSGCSTPGAACGDGGVCLAAGLIADDNICLSTCDAGCRPGYACLYFESDESTTFCHPYCTANADCPAGTICDNDARACVPGSECGGDGDCDGVLICIDGQCRTDIGVGPGAGPGPSCSDLPDFLCTGGTAYCEQLIQFDPTNNPSVAGYDPMLGYIDYPENGESWSNQYRSWLRRENVMAIQYASAVVACKAEDWAVGNGMPVGLIDMSEQNGDVPGTSIGRPGHWAGHEDGRDIDMAYFQVDTADNQARPVCDHYAGGEDASHCTSDPYLLDPWRTALFIGVLSQHPDIRVIGVDGRVGPLVESALSTLCRDGWTDACGQDAMIFEETPDTELGWFLFHHHHFHVSFED